MRKSLKRILYVSLLILLCRAHTLPAAHAAETLDLQRDGSFTIVMEYGGAAIRGAEITLYRVAGTRIEGRRFVYTAAPAFEPAGEDLSDFDTEKNLAEALILRDFAVRNGIAGTAKTTGADGKATFTPLSAGLYLVVQTGSTDSYYDILPFLLSIPMADAVGTEWAYDIESLPKTEISRRVPTTDTPSNPDPDPTPKPETKPDPEPEKEPEPEPEGPPSGPPPVPLDENGVPLGEWRWDPDLEEWILDEFPPLSGLDLPQTGRLQWPIPVMAGAGMILFVLGWVINRKRAER